MPTVTENPVKAYAHCRHALCPGYNQEEIDGIREETALTFGELGGDGIFTSFVERSTVSFRAQDEAQIPCPVCSQPREVTGDPRPSYQPLSGHDPMGLLNSSVKYDAAAVNTPQDAEMAELKATVKRLSALLEPEEQEE